MKHYYIIGSGGCAKEIYFLAQKVLIEESKFMGFIDLTFNDNQVVIGKQILPIIKEEVFLETVPPNDNVDIYLGIGDPKILEKIVSKFKNYNFPNLIAPNVLADWESVSIGKGNSISFDCKLTVAISIGSFNLFNRTVQVGHDCTIGDFNVINPGVIISGGVQMGSGNLLGTNATVLQYLKIGNYATLGAASLATKSIEDHQVMVGVPAKPLNR